MVWSVLMSGRSSVVVLGAVTSTYHAPPAESFPLAFSTLLQSWPRTCQRSTVINMSEHRSKNTRRPRRTGRDRWLTDRKRSPWHSSKNSEVTLITSARKSPLEHWNHRRRTYFFLQGLRIPLILIAALLVWITHNMALGVAVAAISVPLPWIAVLLANETNDPDKNQPKLYKPAIIREQRKQSHLSLSTGQTDNTSNAGNRSIKVLDLNDNSSKEDRESPDTQ